MEVLGVYTALTCELGIRSVRTYFHPHVGFSSNSPVDYEALLLISYQQNDERKQMRYLLCNLEFAEHAHVGPS